MILTDSATKNSTGPARGRAVPTTPPPLLLRGREPVLAEALRLELDQVGVALPAVLDVPLEIDPPPEEDVPGGSRAARPATAKGRDRRVAGDHRLRRGLRRAYLRARLRPR